MGRRPKYLTIDEKDKATQERKRSYAKSAHGKTIRAEQNRRAYQKRRPQATIQEAPLPLLILPIIPNLLVAHAEEPLPLHSMFYQEELRARGDLHEEDVYAYWDHPPYQNPAEHIDDRGLVAFSEAMIGRRRRLQREREAQRLARYDTSSDHDILKEIRSEIIKTMGEWSGLRVIFAENIATSGMITRYMGHYLVQGKARCVMDLVEDWHSVQNNREMGGLAIAYSNRW